MNKEARGSSGGGWKALAIFLAIVLVAAGILTGVFYALGDITFGQAEEQSEAKTETVAYAEDGSELTSGGTVPMQNMTFATARSLAAYSSDAAAQSEEYASVELTATLSPDWVAGDLSWSIAFSDPASEWATDKTVTDYVTLTQGETVFTATVQCLQPFGEQIVVTVSADEFDDVTASCTVDFGQRIRTVTYTGYGGGDMSELSYINWSGGFYDERTVSFSVQYYDYTVTGSLYDSTGGRIPFCVNTNATRLPGEDGVAFSVSTAYHEPLRWTDGTVSASFSLAGITAGESSLTGLTEEEEAELCTWLHLYAGESDIYALKVSVATLYGSYTAEVPLRLDPDMFEATVDLGLDESDIVV